MDRALLVKILGSALGAEAEDGAHTFADDHLASLYLGLRGQTTVLGELVKIVPHDDHLEAHAKTGTVHYVDYEPLFGFAVKPPKDSATKTGF